MDLSHRLSTPLTLRGNGDWGLLCLFDALRLHCIYDYDYGDYLFGYQEKMRGLIFGFELFYFIFIYLCVDFPVKFKTKMRKCKKKKNEIEDVFTCALFIVIFYFVRSLGHMAVQVAIYVARKLYFILAVSNVSIFHPSFNDMDHFDTILKC